RVSSFENLNGVKGAGGKTNMSGKGAAFESLKAGESKTLLDVNSAGIIQRMWVTINDRSPAMLRSLRLRMYWDGADKPAVDVPFGDFFCAGLGRPVAFQSALFTNPEGRSFNCYIPMPFRKGAKVVLTNESKSDLNLLYFDIDYTVLDKPQEDMLYFHACWNRSIHAALNADFELLPSVTGKGRFLGVNIGVNVDAAYGNTWWGEGEVKMYIDGDTTHPTINGTGAEDYIGTGWGEGTFTHLYQGCSIADTAKRQYAFYRFHIPDAIYFNENFKATIQEIGGGMDDEVKSLAAKGVPLKPVSIADEHGFIRLLDHPQALTDSHFPKGWVNFYRIDDYSATAYFYLDKPVSNLKELAPVVERTK
ncbi:MAG: glycoside hydrolase family 172 protein, partial [Mucilaginibacter sp.]